MAPSENSVRRSFITLELILALAALFVVTTAARPLAAIAGGKPAGVFSGLVLFGIVAWAIWRYAEPILNDADSGLGRALLALLIIGAIKLALLPFFPGFGPDVSSYQAWAGRIASAGPALTYTRGYFIDYPPGYLYALWAAGAMVRALGATGTFARVIVETPAVVGDFALAAMVFIYLRRHGHKYGAYAGMLFVAVNPAMLFDTVVWGQSDSVMTLLVLVSALMALDEEYELAWAVAAVAVLVKPQALSFLPVLGFWTLLRTDWRRWWRYALAFAAIAFAGIAPFQINHQWDWIVLLYAHTAAYYHETSVNAFNFMAIIGGLRQPDSTAILGVPLFDIGMALLAPLYLFIGWTLYKRQNERGLIYAIFITILGFFLFAPRMHERYVYPALAFAAILAVSEPEMLLIFVVLTLTCLFNLAYVKHVLETTVFLKSHDVFAMITAAINLVVFAWAVRNRDIPAAAEEAEVMKIAASDREFGMVFRNFRGTGAAVFTVPVAPIRAALTWKQIDTILIALLLAAAGALRFWHLGHPHEIVFDEVHFVAQARHYLRSEPFLDPHPPLAKLVIALGIVLFGDHPWSWRFGNAVIGTALVGVTYLIGRRMFRSRLAATIGAFCIACDGLFLVDSRVAVIDIVYITFAAAAYLFLFRFVDFAGNSRRRRFTLLWMGIALGLCLGAKLYIPAMTFILVVGFLIYVMLRERPPAPSSAQAFKRLRIRRTTGAVVIAGAVSAILYLACFLPKFILGWWGGIANLFHYYGQVIWYENSVASATHPYS
ncbi:MAG: phospholipid carrier-dependent glycosyltransferase, partial [Candidatus Binataceae bacterium]